MLRIPSSVRKWECLAFVLSLIDYDRWPFEVIKIEIDEKSLGNSLGACALLEKSISEPKAIQLMIDDAIKSHACLAIN